LYLSFAHISKSFLFFW